jgi:flagellar biosynthesis/type III secretory pathway protein FliH
MQKWSPEAFSDDVAPVGGVAVDPSLFESGGPAGDGLEAVARKFRSESGFSDPQSLLASLTQEERTQIFELVEMDVAEDYDAREKELSEHFASELQAAKAEHDARFDAWTRELGQTVEEDRRALTAAAADLALQLAGKIVRGAVPLDREALVRAIETTVFKLDKDHPLTVHVSPEDAAWLDEHPQVREKLNIAAVVADRRVETGGAVVKADGREWDVTLGGQLEALGEVVREMVSVGGAGDNTAKDRDEFGLD